MRNFFSCVQKDLRIFGRSKFSAFIAVVIPLVVVLLVSVAFNSNQLHGVRIGVYSPAYSSITNNIIQGFEKQSFGVVKEPDKDTCAESVREGRNHICVIFPGQLSSEGNSEAVEFYVDNSEINIAYALIDDVKTEVGVASSAISLDLVNNLITHIQQAKKSIENQASAITAASTSIASISDAANSAASTLPSTSKTLTLLESARSEAANLDGAENIADTINKTIIEVKQLGTSFNSTSNNIKSLQNNSALAKARLDALSSSLNGVLNDLNAVRITEAGSVVEPIKTEIKPVADQSKNWNFLLPTLLILMVLFGGTVLSSIMASREKRSRAYFRNFITPTSDFTFLLAMYVSSILILIVQFIVVFSGLMIATNLPVLDVIASSAVVLFMAATAFIFLGLSMGHFFKSEEVVILVSLSVVSLLVFFSSIIVPIESVLGQYQQIVAFNPVVVASNLLHRAILFKASIGSLIPGLSILALTVAVFLGLAYVSRKTTKRHI
ncbi:ABC transporter permease [Candidatus Pacearchaeota archaeon]|nr:ABC transporter permease [Candidatus Pacearchaeota archaeon]